MQLVKQELEPELGHLVLDDEEQLVVLHRDAARMLGREQGRQVEIGTVGQRLGEVGGDAALEVPHVVATRVAHVTPSCLGREYAVPDNGAVTSASPICPASTPSTTWAPALRDRVPRLRRHRHDRLPRRPARQALLVEGPAGVGKTELAKAVAASTGARLVRLQCYEGVDEARALYEWNHAKQLLRITAGRDEGGGEPGHWDALRDDIFTDEFLLSRPLLEAVRSEDRWSSSSTSSTRPTSRSRGCSLRSSPTSR